MVCPCRCQCRCRCPCWCRCLAGCVVRAVLSVFGAGMSVPMCPTRIRAHAGVSVPVLMPCWSTRRFPCQCTRVRVGVSVLESVCSCRCVGHVFRGGVRAGVHVGVSVPVSVPMCRTRVRAGVSVPMSECPCRCVNAMPVSVLVCRCRADVRADVSDTFPCRCPCQSARADVSMPCRSTCQCLCWSRCVRTGVGVFLSMCLCPCRC